MADDVAHDENLRDTVEGGVPAAPESVLEEVAVESAEDARVREMLEHSIDLKIFTPAGEAADRL